MNIIIRYFKTMFWGILTISGGQLLVFTIMSIFGIKINNYSRIPIWFQKDKISIYEKFDAVWGYVLAFTFVAFIGLTLVFIVSKLISLLHKKVYIDRIICGILTFIITFIISIALGYYSSLDNFSIWLTGLLGLIFGFTIMAKYLRHKKIDA